MVPDFKTIADFRKDNGKAIREVCHESARVLLSAARVAIHGSKLKAVNARDKNTSHTSACLDFIAWPISPSGSVRSPGRVADVGANAEFDGGLRAPIDH